MNRFFGFFLIFSFLAPINIVQAMDDDLFEGVKGQFYSAMSHENPHEAEEAYDLLRGIATGNPEAARWMEVEGEKSWSAFSVVFGPGAGAAAASASSSSASQSSETDSDSALAQALASGEETWPISSGAGAPAALASASSASSSAAHPGAWLEVRRNFLEAIDRGDRTTAQRAYSDLEEIAPYEDAANVWLTEVGANIWQTYSDSLLAQELSVSQGMRPMALPAREMREDSPQYRVNTHPNIGQLRERFVPINEFMRESEATKQGAGVHFMDDFYGAQVGTLVTVADTLFPENGTLSLEELKGRLKQLLTERPYLLEGYTYQGTRVTLAAMNGYIDQVYQADMPAKLCSHAFNLSLQMAASGDEHGIHRLFDAIAENLLTGGGCLPGRYDRQFVALSIMLMASGL